jgi:putative redox protein
MQALLRRCASSAAFTPAWKGYYVSGGGTGTRCAMRTDDGYEVLSDVPVAAGGGGGAPQPVQLLLAALCGCEQATAAFVAFKFKPQRLALGRIEFELRAERDEQGALTLPLDTAELPAPARLARVWGTATVHGTAATDVQLGRLGEEVHRRCPVANMVVLSGCTLDIEWRRAECEAGDQQHQLPD